MIDEIDYYFSFEKDLFFNFSFRENSKFIVNVVASQAKLILSVFGDNFLKKK